MYQLRIPNGQNILDWPAIGHVDWFGGELNTFGVHFKQSNFTWTRELCEMDSNQDGRTNGDELGDPFCTWTPGTQPYSSLNLTNPGIFRKPKSSIPFSIICHIILASIGLILLIVIGYQNPRGHRTIMFRALWFLSSSLGFVHWSFLKPHGILGFFLVVAMIIQVGYRREISAYFHKLIGNYIFVTAWCQFLLGFALFSEMYGYYYANVLFVCFISLCCIVAIYIRISTK